MTSLRKKLLETLEQLGESWTPDERQFVEVVAEAYAALVARRIAGEDVETELVQVRAQASSIAAGAAGSLSEALEEGIRDFLSDLVREILPGF